MPWPAVSNPETTVSQKLPLRPEWHLFFLFCSTAEFATQSSGSDALAPSVPEGRAAGCPGRHDCHLPPYQIANSVVPR